MLNNGKAILRCEWILLLFGVIFCFILNSGAQIVILGMTLILFVLVYKKAKRRDIDRIAWWYLFPLAVLWAEKSGSQHWMAAFLRFFLIVSLVCIAQPVSHKSARKLLEFIEGVGLLCAISVIVEFFSPSIFFLTIYRLYSPAVQEMLKNQVTVGSYYSGFATEPAVAAGMIVFSFFSLAAQRKVTLGKALLLFGGLILTGKRSHLIFLILTWMAYKIVIAAPTEKVTKIAEMLVIGLAMVGILLVVKNSIHFGVLDRIVETLDIFVHSGGNDGLLNKATSGRYSSYKAAWKFFVQNPIRGIGWGEFGRIYYNEWLGTYLTNVHNLCLQLLCESGFFGLIFFAIPACKTLKKSISEVKYETSSQGVRIFSLLMQLFFLLYSMTETSLDVPFYYMTYFMAVLLAWKSTSTQ